MLVAKLDESLTLAEGVHLNLIDSRHNSCVVEEVLNVGGSEVGNANRLDLAQFLGSLKRTPALVTLLLILGRRMDQVKVKVIKAKLVQRGAKGIKRGLVAMVRVPEFGADEDVLTRGASLLKPAANSTTTSLLVGISGSGIDVTVAGVKGSSDGILGLLAIGRLVDTEGHLRDGVAIV